MLHETEPGRKSGRRQASVTLEPIDTVPAAVPSQAIIATRLIELQVKRKFCIKLQVRNENSTVALLARYLGYIAPSTKELDEAALKTQRKVFDRARSIIKAFPGEQNEDNRLVVSKTFEELELFKTVHAPLLARRAAVELTMKERGRELPVSMWAAGVKGLGELGLAVIVAESGDLSNYSNPSKLWKRLGLAPLAGKSMSTWRKGGGLGEACGMETSKAWESAGYSPRRLAEVFSCVTDPLFRAQGTPEKGNAGPYRLAYEERRARTAVTHPEWTKGHAHNDALRIMTKSLVLDLWIQWRRPS